MGIKLNQVFSPVIFALAATFIKLVDFMNVYTTY